MLDFDDIIKTYFDNDNIGHAYLLKISDFNMIIKIVKIILAKKETIDNIDDLITEGIYPDLKIIEPDGQWIKKEQILNLKEEFKTKSSYNNKRIYVIKNAENLNKSSGNTLLKFLEEPDEDIIALLVTENKNKVLDTIVSRCEFINLSYNYNDNNGDYNDAVEFINNIETKKKLASIEVLEKFSKYEDRSTLQFFLKKVIELYDQIMLNMLKINSDDKTEKMFDKVIKNNKIIDIKKRINGLIFIIDSLEYNINLKLLVDKLMISMFGVE